MYPHKNLLQRGFTIPTTEGHGQKAALGSAWRSSGPIFTGEKKVVMTRTGSAEGDG